MNNKQMFPFERNRYYAGKMLASADFLAEQIYMNNKRRFVNETLFGHGVVSGLGVSNLDDLSVMIESGVALDAAGREIILEMPVVKKLSAVEGFDRLSGDTAQLWIRYQEEKVHPVYAIGSGNEETEYEFNRIREGCEFYLTEEPVKTVERVPSFMQQTELLEQEDYRVTLSMPKEVCRGHYVRLLLTVSKLSDRKAALSFEGVLQMPAFVTKEGEHELSVGMQDIMLEQGRQMKKEYWILAEQGGPDKSSILWKEGAGQAFVGEIDVPFHSHIAWKTLLREAEPAQLALSAVGNAETERTGAEGEGDILLARIHLVRTESAYVISAVEEARSYVTAPSMEAQRQEYLSCFVKQDIVKPSVRTEDGRRENAEEGRRSERPFMTSGTLEIPLNVNMKKGDTCFSEEILHGLGKGDVYVQAGVACLEDDQMGNSVKSTIYGDSDLFQEQDHSWVKTAVRVFNDKGSFQVAARLEGEQRSIVLLINWVAIRFNSSQENRLAADYSEMSIAVRTPTIRLKTKADYHLDVVFRNMKPCRLVYELTENGSGEVTQDGIYTAPTAEGVYEIHIYCADIPQIATYAYAIVSR